MSSQGSLSERSLSYEEKLLECWGDWTRGGIGTGVKSSSIWAVDRPGLLFTERDILRADRAIASLPKAHKRVIKMVFWFKNAGEREYERCAGAVDAFRESFEATSH